MSLEECKLPFILLKDIFLHWQQTFSVSVAPAQHYPSCLNKVCEEEAKIRYYTYSKRVTVKAKIIKFQPKLQTRFLVTLEINNKDVAIFDCYGVEIFAVEID